jgi:putative membrane protein
MKFNTLTAVAAAACMTLGSAVFADPNNMPPSGNDVSGHGVRGAAHGQPNTNDRGGPMTPDNVNNANPSGVNMRRMEMNDPVSSQITMWAKDPNTAGDKLFALEAGCGNVWEVAFAKLEQEKGSDQQVKDLAAHIEKDHAAAEQKLEPIASKLGVNIPQHLSPEKQAKLNLYSQLPADQLDKVYLSEMKADHLKDVNAYADHVKTIQDSDLRTYATDTLPKLREHTAMVLKQNEAKGMPAETSFQSGGSMNQ